MSEHERRLRFEWRDGWATGFMFGCFFSSMLTLLVWIVYVVVS